MKTEKQMRNILEALIQDQCVFSIEVRSVALETRVSLLFSVHPPAPRYCLDKRVKKAGGGASASPNVVGEVLGPEVVQQVDGPPREFGPSPGLECPESGASQKPTHFCRVLRRP